MTNLLKASYPLLMSSFYNEAALAIALPRMTSANPRLLSSGTFYVAETDGGRIIGCGGWTRVKPGTDEQIDGIAHLRHFATHPEFTRRSVGSSIFERCAEIAGTSGCLRFQAFSSLNAEPFYASLGLERVEILDIHLGDGVSLPGVLMEGPIPGVAQA